MSNIILYSRSGNFAVMQFKDRKFPGIFLQGDTFNDIIKSFKRFSESNNYSEFNEALSALEEILFYYEDILNQNNIENPY
jgi:hypothetical protein